MLPVLAALIGGLAGLARLARPWMWAGLDGGSARKVAPWRPLSEKLAPEGLRALRRP